MGEISAYNRQRVVMPPDGQHSRDYRSLSNQGIHPEDAVHHYGSDVLPDHIWAVQGSREDSGVYKVYEVVGSGCGRWGIVTQRWLYLLRIIV